MRRHVARLGRFSARRTRYELLEAPVVARKYHYPLNFFSHTIWYLQENRPSLFWSRFFGGLVAPTAGSGRSLE